MRRSRLAAGLVWAMVLGGCGGGSAPTSAPATSAGTQPAATATAGAATEAPKPTGDATFQLKVAGDASVAGTWQTGTGINCSNPTLAGLNILAFATSPDGATTLVVTISSGSVDVSERAGSGATYVSRDFKGTGVTNYDPAKGATVDSDVAEVPIPGINAGSLGKITHVTAAVACNGQTPGTSSVVASGSSGEGTIAGPFTTVRVICGDSAKDGLSVTIIGVISTTTPPVYMIVNLPGNGNATIFTITENPSKQHSYAIDKATTATVSATGAHLDASFVEVLAAGSSDAPHTIHLAGDVTCGTFNRS